MSAPVIGVDPGKTGALALLCGDQLTVVDMPVVEKIISAALLRSAIVALDGQLAPGEFVTVLVEQPHAMPGNGSIANFSLGRSLGVIEGVIGALGLRVEYVSPQKWKSAMGLSADKNLSRRRAIELWPRYAGDFARVKDHGRAEAALLAHWWSTKL